ncbi:MULTISPECIES: restriction endonuclease subunit S [Aeromicrobium]|uniref:restriction endonuclease subunit S n=1 Tax=Aeromicrobium TaxID=2040 RepID=UPI0025802691|nr:MULTISPECIES: restriction endonuclease subunit S [Aeromicrobium]
MTLSLDKSAWKRVTFGDVVRNVNETVRDLDASGVDRIIAMEHMDPGELKIGRWGSTEDGTTFTRRVKPGQTLFGKRRAYQRKVAYAEFDAICSGDIYTFEADDTQMLGEFLPFLVQSNEFFDHALGTSAGSLSPRTNWRDLANFEFDLPPLDEQKRIADLLWAIERERRSIGLVLDQVDSTRRFVRDDAFASLDVVPTRFASICTIPSQNGVALKKAERAGEVPMVNMGEMFRGEVISTGSDYERVVSPGDNFLLAKGDLLFARRSIVFEGAGACCLVPDLDEPFTFESSVIRVRLAHEVDPSYVLHFFRSRRGRDLMASIVRRGPVSGIAGSDLRTLELPVPDLATQKRIVERIELAGSAESGLHERMAAARALQRTVSSDVFGGN